MARIVRPKTQAPALSNAVKPEPSNESTFASRVDIARISSFSTIAVSKVQLPDARRLRTSLSALTVRNCDCLSFATKPPRVLGKVQCFLEFYPDFMAPIRGMNPEQFPECADTIAVVPQQVIPVSRLRAMETPGTSL
jgi:hypothetical protein